MGSKRTQKERRNELRKRVTIPLSGKLGLFELNKCYRVTKAAFALRDEFQAAAFPDGDPSPQQQSLLEEAVFSKLVLRHYQQTFATGELFDWAAYSQLAHLHVNLLKTLGLERKAKSLPRARDYLEARQP